MAFVTDHFPIISPVVRPTKLVSTVLRPDYLKDDVKRTIIHADFVDSIDFNTTMIGDKRTKWSMKHSSYLDYFESLPLKKSEIFDEFCDHFSSDKTVVKVCFNTTSRSYYWGNKEVISDYKYCGVDEKCVIESNKQVEENWIFPKRNMLPIPKWKEFVHPGVKHALPVFKTGRSDPVKMEFFGPSEVRIWFKTIYVMIRGHLRLERVHSKEIEIYYDEDITILVPIADDNVLQGLYGLEDKEQEKFRDQKVFMGSRLLN